jgi:hypothetical protein
MDRDLDIRARWDGDAKVWTATSANLPGLVVKADTWSTMIEEIRLIAPDLMELCSNPK